MIGISNLRRAAVVAAATPILGLGVPALAASAATYTHATGSHSAHADAHGARVTSTVASTRSWAGGCWDGDGASYTHLTVHRSVWAGPDGAGVVAKWSGTHSRADDGCCGDGYGYGDGDGYGG
jgi:hypothetical protein